MRTDQPAPLAREQRLKPEELFFSTTDRKGVIRSGNEVFHRISRYSRSEMVGRAHNLIRHPDMPRAVFQMLWDRIGAGRPVAAYVKNLAGDGTFYWVLALVVPTSDGYLSIRLSPSSPLFDAARAIYAEVRAAEEEVENGDPRRRKHSIEVGQRKLEELLAQAGFDSYEAFMHVALPTEATARERLLGFDAGTRLSAGSAQAGGEHGRLLGTCGAVHAYLEELVSNVEHYTELSGSLSRKSNYVKELAESIRLFSLNALLAATRLGEQGAALGAVADIMRSGSGGADTVIGELLAEIGAAVDLLDDMGFRIAMSKLETEMMMVFLRELLEGADEEHDAARDLAVLAESLDAGVARLFESLGRLRERVDGIARHGARLRDALGLITRLEVNGRIEAARLSNAGAVLDLFTTVGQQVTAARAEMADFATVDRRAQEREAAGERQVLERLRELEQRVAAIAR